MLCYITEKYISAKAFINFPPCAESVLLVHSLLHAHISVSFQLHEFTLLLVSLHRAQVCQMMLEVCNSNVMGNRSPQNAQ